MPVFSNLLQLSYLSFLSLMFFGFFYIDSFPGDASKIYIGLLHHAIFSIFAILGLLLGRYLFLNGVPPKAPLLLRLRNLNLRSYLIYITFLVIGMYGSFATISHFASLSDYAASIGAIDSIRSAYELSSSEGGAPGYLKFLSYSTNGVYAAACILFSLYSSKKTTSLWWIIAFSILAMLFKIFISLDRASILLLIVGIALLMSSAKLSKFFFSVLAVLGIILLNATSSLRLKGFSIFDFLGLYSSLGFSNFGIVISSVDDCYGLGFYSFFAPFNPIISRFLGFVLGNDCLSNNWTSNPAQYFFSHL